MESLSGVILTQALKGHWRLSSWDVEPNQSPAPPTEYNHELSLMVVNLSVRQYPLENTWGITTTHHLSMTFEEDAGGKVSRGIELRKNDDSTVVFELINGDNSTIKVITLSGVRICEHSFDVDYTSHEVFKSTLDCTFKSMTITYPEG